MSTDIFNRRFSRFRIASILSSSLSVSCLAAFAGPQSLLDPYATVEAPSTKIPTRSALSKRSAMASGQLHKQSKVKAHVSNQSIALNKSALSNNKTSDKACFVDGLKEIGHGYMTCFRATGSGAVTGSKMIGIKMADGARSISAGMSSLSHKAMPAKASFANNSTTSKQNLASFAGSRNKSTAKSLYPPLPGKPLDQIAEDRPVNGKDKPLGEYIRESRIAHSFRKLNFFNKNKKQQVNQMTASNPNSRTGVSLPQ